MRRMSFEMMTDAIRDRSKTVTRRPGWKNLKPGEILAAVEKCMVFEEGYEAQESICTIRVVSVRREPIRRLWSEARADPGYGPSEVRKEGLGEYDMTCVEFSLRLCSAFGLRAKDEVTRIEFEYVT